MENNTIKYIILEEILNEGRYEDSLKKYPSIPPGIVNHLADADPSGNNKYLDWMCKQIWDGVPEIDDYTTIKSWLDNYSHRESIENIYANHYGAKIDDIGCGRENGDGGWLCKLADIVLEEVTFFHRFAAGLTKKDINQYDYNSLQTALAEKKLKAIEKGLAKEVTKIFEDTDWLIISPKSHAASCAYGAGTKWCVTTKQDPSYYNQYTNNDFYLMFVINKKTNQKWAINTLAPIGAKAEKKEINLPWHREIQLAAKKPIERYSDKKHNKAVKSIYQIIHGGKGNTSYWNADDSPTTWDLFIKNSNLPQNLQDLIKYVENRVTINFAKKKKTDVAYEVNPEPNKLRKGDKVKLLASGYGYFRGDEGYILRTTAGVSKEKAGIYLIFVLGRKVIGQDYSYKNQAKLEGDDKLLPKLNLQTGDFRELAGGIIKITGVNINGVYLKKIE